MRKTILLKLLLTSLPLTQTYFLSAKDILDHERNEVLRVASYVPIGGKHIRDKFDHKLWEVSQLKRLHSKELAKAVIDCYDNSEKSQKFSEHIRESEFSGNNLFYFHKIDEKTKEVISTEDFSFLHFSASFKRIDSSLDETTLTGIYTYLFEKVVYDLILNPSVSSHSIFLKETLKLYSKKDPSFAEQCTYEKIVAKDQGAIEALLTKVYGHVEPDLTGPYGYTPLHSAVKKEHEPLVALLLEAGANKKIRSPGSTHDSIRYAAVTPFEILKWKGKSEKKSRLLKLFEEN